MSTKSSKENKYVIRCPHCGAEYHPAEIYMPTDLLGKPKTILRDPDQKILYTDYAEDENPCPITTFVCDHCNKTMVISASVSYKVEKEEEILDFEDTSVNLLDN